MTAPVSTAGIGAEDRLNRAHVVNVGLRPSGVFIVVCSDGTDLSWAEWCAWGRDSLASSPATAGRADGAEGVNS